MSLFVSCVLVFSGPVVATVWEGRDIISISRRMIGATNPSESAIGTIRGDYASHFRRNLVHGSDSEESAAHEIGLWFREEEIFEWDQSMANWILELPNAPITFGDDAPPDYHPGHLAGLPGSFTSQFVRGSLDGLQDYFSAYGN